MCNILLIAKRFSISLNHSGYLAMLLSESLNVVEIDCVLVELIVAVVVD